MKSFTCEPFLVKFFLQNLFLLDFFHPKGKGYGEKDLLKPILCALFLYLSFCKHISFKFLLKERIRNKKA